MARTKSVKAGPASYLLRNEIDVANSIQVIGEKLRALDALEAAMNDKLAEVKKHFDELAARDRDEIRRHADGIRLYCETNRAVLTKDGRTKTARFATGTVAWRMTPPRVVIRQVDKVLEALKAAKLKRFIRLKEEIDKEAILRDREAVAGIKGIAVEQREEIVIKPFGADLETTA